MAAIERVSSISDLRKTKFADLFYRVLDSDDKEKLVKDIAQAIEPEYKAQERKETNNSTEELSKLKKKLEKKRKKRKERQHELEDQWELSACDETVEAILRARHKTYVTCYSYNVEKGDDVHTRIEKFRLAAENWNESNVRFDRVVDELLAESGGEKKRIIEWIAYSEPIYDGVISEMQTRLLGKSDARKKYIEALLLLPKLDDDQDMIVYFGSIFHTTIDSIDAYTGLLYAFEYFEYVGIA